MAKVLNIDIESFSDVDLIKCGVYAYADSPAFEVLLFAYSFDEGEIQIVDLAQGEELPAEVESAIFDESVMKTAFNANFERTCLSKHFGKYLSPMSWYCSAVQAAMLALPRSLADVGEVLGLENQKMKEGKDLIRYFCLPCKPTKANGGRTRNLPCHAPEKWELFKKYCIRDVEVEQAVRLKLRNYPIPDNEMELYCLDQEINDRGVLVDRVLVEKSVSCDLLYKDIVTKRAYELTGLENPNSVAQIKGWLDEKGLEVESLSKKAVGDLIPDSDGEVQEMLKLRLLMAKTSVKKYEAIQRSVCLDGRVHGLLQFYGANRTGRWCLTGDHEVLTVDGWKRLDEWDGGVIACWQPNGEIVSFQKSEKVQFDYDGAMYAYDDKRISQFSTPDHKMYVKRRYGGIWQVDTVENMCRYRPSIPFIGYRRNIAGMEHDRLRVLVMVQADAYFTEDGSIRMHFKKKRKIERCKHLLRRAGIQFSIRDYSKAEINVIMICSRDVPLWLRIFRDKTFGSWLFDESADVFFEELAYWDGYHAGPNSIQYCTCNKQNADMVQAFAHISGRSAIIRIKKHSTEHPNWKDAYIVDIWLTPINCHEIRNKPQIIDYSGKVYCAVTSTGYFLVRRNGRVWITGNSGKLVQIQNLPQNHLSDLELARSLIKQGRFEDVELLYDSIPNVLSELIRTAFIPKPGCRFIVADFSAIEARVLAWLSGEKWRLEVFETHGKIYEASASSMFHVPIEEIGKGSPFRQKGKVAELACIAEGSLVLTDKGLIPIECVQKKHFLWDGVEWVKHDGVVFRGEMKSIEYGGLRATEDHLVWVCGKQEPVHFGEAARSGVSLLYTGNGRKAVQLGKDYSNKEVTEQMFAVSKGTVRVYDILNAGPRHRFTVSGILVHNCGYGGGIGALKSMGALEMGVEESELPNLISNWRNANSHITQFWWDVDKAAIKAVTEKIKTKVGKIAFEYQSGILFITLPSGRKLSYVKPRMALNRFGRNGLTYEGIGENKKWVRIETYGPKLVENIVQGTARDLLAEAMLRVDKMGYPIVMHCHDEIIAEVPDGLGSVDEMCRVMAEQPEWAEGLPLRADGYECGFYKKD